MQVIPVASCFRCSACIEDVVGDRKTGLPLRYSGSGCNNIRGITEKWQISPIPNKGSRE